MASKVKLFTLEEDGDEPRSMGKINSKEDESYASLRERLEKSSAIPWHFDFWDPDEEERIGVPLEGLNTYVDHVYVVKKVSDGYVGRKRPRLAEERVDFDSITQDLEDDTNLPQTNSVPVDGGPPGPSASSRVDADSNGEAVEGLQPQQWLKSSLIPPEVMEKYLDFERKTRRELRNRDMDDHNWVLKSFDQNGVAIVKLHCLECGKDCGGSSGKHSKDAFSNLFNNFKNSHVVTDGHIRHYCRKKNILYKPLPTTAKGKSTPTMTVVDHKELVQEGLKIMETVNKACEANRPTFVVVGDVDSHGLKSYWFKARCTYCNECFMLCPTKKQLESNLINHGTSIKHLKRVQDVDSNKGRGAALSSGRKGRPSRSSRMTASSNQQDLHSWLKGGPAKIQVGHWNPADSSQLQSFMCWGFRGTIVVYAGKSYKVTALLDDPHPGVNWYCEPHVSASFAVGSGRVIVSGCFKHRECVRFSTSGQSFVDFNCAFCVRIPLEIDFRLRVVREDRAVEKRDSRGTGLGRRLDYLSTKEVVHHSRSIKSQLKLHHMMLWHAKSKIAQLKITRPTIREAAKASSGTKNVLQFVNNIIAAHRSGALGSKAALWSFMKDVATNLNRKKSGHRFATNTKCFTQAMKMYGRKRMVDLFSLNYGGPKISTVIRENRKGVQFIPGEHAEVFRAVANIYRNAKEVHNISGLVPVILAEDETKVKSRVAYEQKWDTLAGFCGLTENHVCVSDFKPVVGLGEAGYAKILESFHTHKVGGFARIIIVNPLHQSLPRLLLVVC